MKNVLKQLPKSVLIPLKLTAAASPADAAIQKKKKKKYEPGMITLIIENLEMYYIMKKKVSQRWFLD